MQLSLSVLQTEQSLANEGGCIQRYWKYTLLFSQRLPNSFRRLQWLTIPTNKQVWLSMRCNTSSKSMHSNRSIQRRWPKNLLGIWRFPSTTTRLISKPLGLVRLGAGMSWSLISIEFSVRTLRLSKYRSRHKESIYVWIVSTKYVILISSLVRCIHWLSTSILLDTLVSSWTPLPSIKCMWTLLILHIDERWVV